MFLRSVRMQTAGILRKKTAAVTYLLLMGFVLVNFFLNLWQNHEAQYVTQMFDPVKILTLSDWSYSGFYMRTYFPLLVVLPTACSYLSDRQTRMQVYMEARTGRTSYWMGKFLAVFLATFIIFTLPFLLELALNVICFGLEPMGDPSNFPYLDTLAEDSRIFLSGLWFKNRVLYAVVMIVLFGAASGILAVFNFVVTLLPGFRYRVFAYFPVYVLIHLLHLVEQISGRDYTMDYAFILCLFEQTKKNYPAYGLFLLVLLLAAAAMALVRSKGDDLT